MAAARSAPPAEEWVADVLAFWFDTLGADRWFKRQDATDALIRQKFGDLHHGLSRADPAFVPGDRDAALAAVIVLDQFSRNLFRGTAAAFASDARGRTVARLALEREWDAGLPAERALFFYLPFEHSEDPADQALAVERIGRLGNAEWSRYAVAHQVIIDRFGRFPHRNGALGRVSTPEEIAFLQEPGSSF